MKIAISGAGNCGKTTLAKHFSITVGLPIIDEGYFDIVNTVMQGSIDFDILAGKFLAVQKKKFTAEKRSKKGFVADRSSIDLFQYWLTFHELRNDPFTLDFYKLCRRNAQRYDFVVFPPWGVAAYSDLENRSTDNNRKYKYPWTNLDRHSSILGLAHHWLPTEKILQVPTDLLTVEEWTSWLVEKIPPKP